ncbi:Mini-ribonuclease 3 [Oculatella sp. LEGE 06141]|nr:Mini-ribonuclease 3 [Oculatella sp. LEGE 06141]
MVNMDLMSQFVSLFSDVSRIPSSMTPGQARQLSPASLAYIGDAVYELYIRTLYLSPPRRLQDYHHCVVAQVRAEKQAQHLGSLQLHLTDAEREIIRWGRNAVSRKPKRVALATYQQATSLETLIGYLYLTDSQRLFQLLDYLESELTD